MSHYNKLKIWQDPAGQNPCINSLYLKLFPSDERLDVCAVDKEGNILPRGYLASIDAKGRLHIHPGVDPSFGFPLDEDGCILVKDSNDKIIPLAPIED